MGLFDRFSRKQKTPTATSQSSAEPTKYKSPEELKIKPGSRRYEIYSRIVEGKSHEQIFEELLEIGEYDKDAKKWDALNYIEYFHNQMKRSHE